MLEANMARRDHPQWNEDDRIYVSEVPELPGCMALGATQPAALKSVNQAIDLWLDDAKEFGDPIQAPRGRRLMLA